MNNVILTAGLGYGDEGKGSCVDYLVRKHSVKLVCKSNGGAQTAHNVVEGSRHHTFSQFGSGTFAGARTLLTRHVLFNPFALVSESHHLSELGIIRPLSLIDVERSALITTPFHIAANRIREMSRGTGRHGSCGMGIGETAHDAILHPDVALRASDLLERGTLRGKLLAVRERMLAATEGLRALCQGPELERVTSILDDDDTVELCFNRYSHIPNQVRIQPDGQVLHQALEAGGTVVFEGAQGVLLDQAYGFHPHTTWSRTTYENALEAIQEAHITSVEVTRLGILRAYATRHGAGPLVTEDCNYDSCSAHDHNKEGEWQNHFRSGALDLVSAKYAIDVLGGVDGIAMTCLDRLAHVKEAPPLICTAYKTTEPIDEELFEGSHTEIFKIRVSREADLVRQERLTRDLFNVRPLYDPPLHEKECEGSVVSRIESLLQVPVVMRSNGPTALDKR